MKSKIKDIANLRRKVEDSTKENITACFRCGHKDLEWAGKTQEVAVWLYSGLPIMGLYRCKHCGYFGVPLEFYSERDLKKYQRMREKEFKQGKWNRRYVEEPESRLHKYLNTIIGILGIILFVMITWWLKIWGIIILVVIVWWIVRIMSKKSSQPA